MKRTVLMTVLITSLRSRSSSVPLATYAPHLVGFGLFEQSQVPEPAGAAGSVLGFHVPPTSDAVQPA